MLKKIWLVLFLLLPLTVARAVDAPLLISEVQITGGDSKADNDFIKIYNNTPDTIDLNGYCLIKHNASGTPDSIKSWSKQTLLDSKGFYLWANSADGFAESINANASTTATLSINNSIAICKGTATLCKSTADETLFIDKLAWGQSTNPLVEGSIFLTNPAAGQTLKRINNLDTNNNAADFELTGIFTPPADNNPISNVQNQTSNSGGGGNIYCQAMKGDVLINEFLSSPGEDEEEWVELLNNCSQAVNLEGWTLEDGSGTKTTLSGIFDKYFVIDAPKGKLNNAGDLIILKNNNGQIIDELIYGVWQEQSGPKAPGIGQSLALDPNTHEFTLCTKPTKGSVNIIDAPTEEKTTIAKTTATSSPIIISEILPNPLGADNDGEFIELFNQSSQTIALKYWQLTNEVGQIFIFPNIVINASTSVAFYKITTNLSLKNDHDIIKLYAPNSKATSQSVSYKNATEGQSYIYDTASKSWQWSLVATPNKPNFLIKPNAEPTALFYAPDSAKINEKIFLDASDSFDPFSTPLTFDWDFGDKATSTLNAVEHKWTKAGTYTIKLMVSDGELSNTKESKIKIIDPKAAPELAIAPSTMAKQVAPQTTANNSMLKISAIVVTAPGLFGTQWFYAMPLDDSGKATNAVIQIYNNKKEFPTLKIGDLIEAQGELYAIKDDTRLKTKTATDITVLEHDNILIEKTVGLSDLNKNLVNELISVSGKVAKQQGNNIILSDGTKELLVELKPNTKLRAKDFTPDSSYQITGLLKQAGNQLKLWPRYTDDIILLDSKQVLGEKIESTTSAPTATINFVSGKGKEKTLEYLLITALGLIIGLSVLLFKLKKPTNEPN